MLLREYVKTNTIIATTLISGKNISWLITKEMIYAMPSGSVTVDLAAESDRNVETAVAGEAVTVTGKNRQNITCVGYTDILSRMVNVTSQLYNGNVTKLIQSMDRQGKFVVENGKPLKSYVPPLAPKPVAKIEGPVKIKRVAVQNNPQMMTLDKVLFCFILVHQQQLLDWDQRYLN